MKKIIKVLMVLLVIAILIAITLSRYVEERLNISREIGTIWNGGPISTTNYVTIIKNFEKYIALLNEKNYEEAYKMTFYEYAKFKDYESYCSEMNNKDYSDVYVKNIIRRTIYVYSIFLSNEEENLFILNQDETGFAVVPTTLIEYKTTNKSMKKRNVEYKLKNIANYINKYEAEIEIKNNTKETINISKVKLKNNAKLIDGDISSILVAPKETKNIKVKFETHIDFPNAIEISRYIEKKNANETYIITID